MIKESLIDSMSDENLFNLLTLDIVIKLDLKSKSGEPYYMEKDKVSKLMNNKMNVPAIFRKSINKEAASIDNLEKYFSEKLKPRLIPEKIDILCAKLIEKYSCSEDLSYEILKDLKAFAKEKKTIRLLAYVFRLSLTVPNKLDSEKNNNKPTDNIDRKRPIRNTEIHSDNNIRCLQAVIEAYRSKIGDFKCLNIQDYPQFKNHFKRQKEAYFAAEAVRHASRESFLIEENPFEDLLDESYDGVSETWEREYKNGLERMEAVLSQAVQISMESNLISRETVWVTVRVKKGLCHILVNEGRIEGWVYDNNL